MKKSTALILPDYIPGRVSISETGLSILKPLSLADCNLVMGKLKGAISAIRWASGDLLVYVEKMFPREYTAWFEGLIKEGSSRHTLMELRRMAIYFPREKRVALSWSHHRDVATRSQEDRDRLLGLAIEKGLNKEELVAVVKQERGETCTCICPACGKPHRKKQPIVRNTTGAKTVVGGRYKSLLKVDKTDPQIVAYMRHRENKRLQEEQEEQEL